MRNSVIIPEFKVLDCNKSLDFYTRLAGFTISYQRLEHDFAMLEINGSKLMIEGLNDKSCSWLVSDLRYPFGRGMHLQIEVENVDGMYENFKQNKYPIFLDIEEKSYRANDIQVKHRQFLVQDPDGYLLRFFSHI